MKDLYINIDGSFRVEQQTSRSTRRRVMHYKRLEVNVAEPPVGLQVENREYVLVHKTLNYWIFEEV